MRRKTVGLLLLMFFLSAFVITTGCARKRGTMSPEFPEGEPAAAEYTPESRPRGAEARLGEGAGEGFEEGDLPIQQTRLARELIFEEAGRELQTIYFDYDSAVLKPLAKTNLERAANWLKKNSRVNIQIGGHCDERGTNEYNLALGERRALSARRYLVSLGIRPDRIFTISYGEERPAREGHSESAWKFNRRDEFKISF